jgi:hypothetical protein
MSSEENGPSWSATDSSHIHALLEQISLARRRDDSRQDPSPRPQQALPWAVAHFNRGFLLLARQKKRLGG